MAVRDLQLKRDKWKAATKLALLFTIPPHLSTHYFVIITSF